MIIGRNNKLYGMKRAITIAVVAMLLFSSLVILVNTEKILGTGKSSEISKINKFVITTYKITFSETGLPINTTWYVNLSTNQFFSLTGSSITINEPNGTYNFTIATVNKLYAPSPSQGSFNVNGSNLNIAILFKPVLYTVTFSETGLPSGTNWSVTFGNITKSSNTNYIKFVVSNGSYQFVVASISGFIAKPSSGIISINGNNYTQAITFVPQGIYSVTFKESGLPSGTAWYINLSNGQSLSVTGASVTIGLSNGTYNFSIASGDKKYAPFPSSGTFTVNGAPLTISINFKLVTYTVTFTESGLPTGTTWYVNLSNGQTYSGTGTTITFNEPNGSYTYTIATVNKIYAPSPYSGAFTINGANVNLPITFTLVTYNVTFTESGLPTGTTWYVNLSNGQTYSGTGTTITFNEPNGSYTYTIATVNKSYAPNPYTGSFTVSGANVNVPITFILVTYTVTFTESGLPTGTKWYVNLSNGQTYSGTGTTITFNEPNGSYTFSIATTNKSYSPSPTSGIFKVNGLSVSISINFSLVTFAVNFVETGLPSGTVWYVNLTNDQSFKGNVDTITIYEPNGSYSYTIATKDKRYSPLTPYGNFTVNGKGLNISIPFKLITYVVIFNETGLPSGSIWFVNLSNGQSFNGNASYIKFNEPNGTYIFSIATTYKLYAPTPQTGTFYVNGANVTVSIKFYLVTYTIIINAINLPSGTLWYVNLTNGEKFSSNNSTIKFSEPNGTYNFTVATKDKRYEPLNQSGSFIVQGSSVNISIKFILVTYKITFNENGLPLDTLWFVNISTGQSFSGNTSTISIFEPNGSYSFNIATVDKRYSPVTSSGYFTINGAGLSINITFYLITFSVTFRESGLPSGTTWFVNLSNGQSFSGTGTTITFSEPNGTYVFYVATVNKFYAPSPFNGNFVVNGKNVNIDITFYLVMYTITFLENGLPSNTLWYINLSNGQRFSGTGSQLSFTEPNGSYSFTISTVDKRYYPIPSEGSIVVNGGNVNVIINFRPYTYTVLFKENGLPPGTMWYVNLSNGQSYSGNNTNISFGLMNGTYSFYISTSNKDYYPSPLSGSFTVNGNSVSISIKFTLLLYMVRFVETGLPLGTKWYVNLTGVGSFYSTNNTIIILLSNGTYHYTVSTVNKDYAPASPLGSFTVSGSSISPQIYFYPYTYPVLFQANGLPSGTTWFVNISGYHSIQGNGNALTFYGQNGTYSFYIATSDKRYAPYPYHGEFIINGSGLKITILFNPVKYNVTFIENYLPQGTLWFINISNGISLNGTGNKIVVALMNGTYGYTIGTVDKKYSAAPGYFTINGSSAVLYVNFSLVVYRVTFFETGLYPGTNWWVKVGSLNVSSNGNTILMYLPNGTYEYSLPIIQGYMVNNSGKFTVYGNNINITITWVIIKYKVTIVQSGIPNGTLWSVILAGRTFYGENLNITLNSTTDRIIFLVPNGSYSYWIHLPKGYSTNVTAGTINISGNTVVKNIYAQPGFNYAILLAIVLIIIAVILVIIFMRKRKRHGVKEWKEPLKNN
ncbi:MAG: hypothetical protein GPW18_02595 [Euryarchaeota archaeon]|nr:hypothetical protein [Euryarchaeota archaeon]